MIAGLLLFLALQAQPFVDWQSDVQDGKIVLTGTPESGVDHVSGTVTSVACAGNACHTPEDYEFDLSLKKEFPSVVEKKEVPVSDESSSGGSVWALILEAVLWGLAMLLTPCVFPMVPMTVSFFLKGGDQGRSGRLKALMYGLFIVLLYTVPICLIIGITRLVGGEGVTADIFNWLSTHWIPNILFFVVFMVFAASFFGAFEITLPGSWTNSADRNSDRKGLGGIFFLALTLVLVSFSCTGPIVGTVLIKSTQGEFWTPMITMLAFSVAFALPFSILAFFPSLMKRLPKSGGWLNSVKVVLGFVELALGLKFLSTADQTYHWGILGREVYLSVWIAIFMLMGMYLLGVIRFKYDDEIKYVSVKRLFLAIITFSFAIYLVTGLFGAPLKALSGYLPPMENKYVTEAGMPLEKGSAREYTSLSEGFKAAGEQGKRVFLDITGYGCVNCREMELRVWSDPEVSALMEDEFVVVKLYVDDKTKLPESEWVTTDSGKILKDVGRVNSYISLKEFGVNSQPNYFIMDADGNILGGPYSYNLDIEDFINFLLNSK